MDQLVNFYKEAVVRMEAYSPNGPAGQFLQGSSSENVDGTYGLLLEVIHIFQLQLFCRIATSSHEVCSESNSSADATFGLRLQSLCPANFFSTLLNASVLLLSRTRAHLL